MGLQPQVDQSAAYGIGAIKNRRALFNKNNATYDWLTGSGDPTTSPLYKSFLTKTREGISNTYDNAVMNARANANARGFGYASPNEQTAEFGIRGEEAGQLARAPSTALQQTIPFELQATGQRLQEGEQLTSSSNNDLNNVNRLALEQNRNKMAMIQSLSALAGTILGGPIGGAVAGKLTKPATGAGPSDWNNDMVDVGSEW